MNKKSNRVGGSIFAIIGLLMMIGAWMLFQNDQKFAKEAASATGTVVESVYVKSRKWKGGYYAVVEFQTADGKRMTFRSDTGRGRPVYENGRTRFECADERLYPNYLTWCQRTKREPLALRRFSGLAVDMARSLGADVSKFTSCKGAHLKGLRLRREDESPHDWLGSEKSYRKSCLCQYPWR